MAGFGFSEQVPIGVSVTPTFDGSSWSDVVQAAVQDGLQVYSTVARNNQAGQQISQGQNPTALFAPATPTGTVPFRVSNSTADGTGILSSFTPGTWLVIIVVVFLLFALRK